MSRVSKGAGLCLPPASPGARAPAPQGISVQFRGVWMVGSLLTKAHSREARRTVLAAETETWSSGQRPRGQARVTLPTARPQSLPLPASAQQPTSSESTALGGAFEPTGHFVYAHIVLRIEMTQGCTLTRGPAYLETCPTWSRRLRGGLPDLVCLCFGKCTVSSLLPHASLPQFPQSQGPCPSPGILESCLFCISLTTPGSEPHSRENGSRTVPTVFFNCVQGRADQGRSLHESS